VSAPRLGFIGNRFSTLSWTFFRALDGLARSGVIDLVLIDSSTRAEARIRRRARNAIVSAVKTMFGGQVATASIDWFRRSAALRYSQITPVGHSLRDPSLPSALQTRGVTAVLVAGCDQILRDGLISAVPRIVNYHNSALPAHRGCNAVEWACLLGDAQVGYSYHSISSEEIDAGRILLQEAFPLDARATAHAVDDLLAERAAARLSEIVEAMFGPSWPWGEVARGGGSYHHRGEIQAYQQFDPRLAARELVRRFDIFGSLRLTGGTRITLLESAAANPAKLPAGQWRVDGNSVEVGCQDGPLRIRALNYLPARMLAWSLPDNLTPSLPIATTYVIDRPA
jgi:methionyl-tRNA formyltransferase